MEKVYKTLREYLDLLEEFERDGEEPPKELMEEIDVLGKIILDPPLHLELLTGVYETLMNGRMRCLKHGMPIPPKMDATLEQLAWTIEQAKELKKPMTMH